MNTQHLNGRTADLLEPAAPKVDLKQSAVRSKAQREAARRNGARSRGPVSRAGKAKSRMNSSKHGLLARFLVPPTDVRDQDRLYFEIRRELYEELRPSTYTQRATVDTLAHDFVQLARAGAMVEALQRPAPVANEMARKWDAVLDVRQKLASLKHAERALEDAGLPSCGRRDADRAAAEVVALVTTVKADMIEAEDDDAEATDGAPTENDVTHPGATAATGTTKNADPKVPSDYLKGLDLDAYEREEAREREALWAAVRPPRDGAATADRITAVLRGRTKAGKAERAWLLRTVQRSAAALQTWLKGRDDLVREMEAREASRLRTLASDPNGLMLLQRYQKQIQRAIDQKLRKFEAG